MRFSPARSELDSMIVEIELTLISIIQGVALTFLIENAKDVLSTKDIIYWPYIVAGLFVIFVFWSRSVLHIITVIRWPLEFGHNFLYIACALVEALLFTRLTNPRHWFLLGTLFAVIGWTLFAYDMRLIRTRKRDSAGPVSDKLLALVERDQWRNIIVLIPGVLLLNLAGALLIHWWPDLFLAHEAHVWLAAAQVVGFGGYLYYVIRFYAKLAPLIADARAEWRSQPDHGDV